MLLSNVVQTSTHAVQALKNVHYIWKLSIEALGSRGVEPSMHI